MDKSSSLHGSPSLPEDATEIVSQDENILYTGLTCTQNESKPAETSAQSNNSRDGSFDPDETYVSVSMLRPKRSAVLENRPNICNVEEEPKKNDSVNGVELQQELSNVSSTYSQELTQPATQTHEIDVEGTPPTVSCQDDSTSKSVNDTLELVPSQDIQNSLSPTEYDKLEDRLHSRASTMEVKPENTAETSKTDSGNNLKTLTSSSSSSSNLVSSSSSSKRATESDDTDDMVVGSQDMFVSQEGFSPQPNIISVSQMLPTLQLSGDLPLSQSYEGFKPSRICPSSPTSGTTSTPLRQFCKSSNDLRKDAMSLSDEDIQKLSEKRKLSDSSDEAKPELKRVKKSSFHSRPSVYVVDEVFKHPSTEDLTIGSQGYTLHLSQTDSDLEISQTENISPLNQNGSLKPCPGSQTNVTTATAAHDSSIVSLDDGEDEVSIIPQNPEITLDSSGPADIEVLTPSDKHANKQRTKSEEDPDLSNNQLSTVNGELLDHIKNDEEKQNNQNFETELVLTFTCTYKVTCKASIDALKKNTTSREISSFEILESKTVPKRDSSPSAVEESSPGRGGGSPGSVMSGPGLFALRPTHASRISMFSTTSSSSADSAASHYHHRQARRGRPPAGLSNYPGNASPGKLNPLAPWKELLSQCQDELALSGSIHMENWEASRMHNSSSDDSKTIGEERVLDPVPEGDDEILGIPERGTCQKSSYLLLRNRTVSANSSNNAASADSEPNMAETTETAKTECDTPSTKRKRGRPAKSATPRTPSGSTKKKAQTPRAKKSSIAEAEEQSCPPDDSLSAGSDYFSPGALVFALWKDGFYYQGHLGASTRPNQWNVAFHDGTKRDLSKNEIHLINTFVIGQSVHAKSDKDYKFGTVVDVIPGTDGEDDLYKIKIAYSGTVVTVPISDLSLSEDQMKQIISDPFDSTNGTTTSSSPSKRTSASKLGSIDLDNILPGKRVRTPKASQGVINSPGRPGPSSTARRLISDGCSSSAAEDEPLAKSLITIPNIPGVQTEQVGFEKTADPLARKGKGIKKSASKKPLPDIDDEKIVQELGPMPPEGSRIFMGYSFLLTITDVCLGHRHEPVTDSERNTTDVDEQPDDDSSHCASDYECYQFAKARMVKDRLMRQLVQGGGKVLKHWCEIVPKDINNTYVVSNRPCSTAIFLQCLVRGVKGINHECIIHCCRENKKVANCLKSYLLPPGYSLKRKVWALWSEHKRKQPLQSETILVEGDKDFKEFWEEILQLSGAKVATIKSTKGIFGSLTKILSTHSCSAKTLKQALDANVPVVSPLWVIQSLVENKPLLHNDVLCFAHDYVDCD